MSESKARRIKEVLARTGVPPDGVLFVHSALKGLSRDGHTAEAVLDALMDYMAPGTLLLPTMSWRFVKPDKPFFDELKTPSNTGILTEIFRQSHATHRSLHPTHSVSGLGVQAAAILDSHHRDDTPCGQGSPFAKLTAADAWVLLLGISMDCCTLIHHAEEIVAPELYLRPPEQRESYTCRDRDGVEHTVHLRRHLFLPRDYWQFQDRLAADGKLKVDQVDSAVCRVMRAREVVDCAVSILRQRPDAVLAAPGGRYRMM